MSLYVKKQLKQIFIVWMDGGGKIMLDLHLPDYLNFS